MNARPTFRLAPGVRRAIEDEVARLLDVLDASEPDADLEPCLGWTTGGHIGNCRDLEGNLADTPFDREHDPAESGDCGWRSNSASLPQEGWAWHGLRGGMDKHRNNPTATA